MKLKYVLPNLITLGNLACGIFAIFYTLSGSPFFAIHLIFLGMIIDFFDGKIARLTNTVSQIGTYLDSFSDIISFGIAPTIVIYKLCPNEYRQGLLFFLFLYAGSGLFRLVRYTFSHRYKKQGTFSGIPIPAAAGVMSSLMLMNINTQYPFHYGLVVCTITIISCLMVSALPYQHFSQLFSEIPNYIKIIILTMFVLSFFVRFYHFFIFICFFIYMIFGIKWAYRFEVKVNS